MNNIGLCQAFLNRESIAGVEYQHNDYVRVIDWLYQGKAGLSSGYSLSKQSPNSWSSLK